MNISSLISNQNQDSTLSQQNWEQNVIAIIYSTIWTLQSVVQIVRNYNLKTMEGMSVDFYLLALNANIFYAIYSVAGYLHYPGTGTVLFGDMLYPCGTLLLAVVEGSQYLYYPSGVNIVARKTILFTVGCWVFIIFNLLFTEILGIFPETEYWNVLSIMGYCKLAISVIKYAPAVYWNYKMKTTKGWPTLKVLMDITGGILSLVSGSVSVQDGINVTKLLLAILTLVYDFIFLFQRSWYKDSHGKIEHGIYENEQTKAQQQQLLKE